MADRPGHGQRVRLGHAARSAGAPPAEEVVGASADPVSLYATVAGALTERARGRPFVLMIDDLPRLDRTSLTLVGHLLDANAIFLIGTVRTGEAVGLVADFMRRGHLVRIDWVAGTHRSW